MSRSAAERIAMGMAGSQTGRRWQDKAASMGFDTAWPDHRVIFDKEERERVVDGNAFVWLQDGLA